MEILENKIDLKEFLDYHCIYYLKIHYFICDKTHKKIPMGEKNNISLNDVISKMNIKVYPKDYYYIENSNKKYEKIFLTESELRSRVPAYSIFLKYTKNLFVIDCDEENINTLEDFQKKTEITNFYNCPWLKGNIKGIHIMVNITNVPDYTNQQNVFKSFIGDFFHSKNNVWERIDKFVENTTNKIPTIDFKDIEKLFNNRFFSKNNNSKEKEKSEDNINIIQEKDEKINFNEYSIDEKLNKFLKASVCLTDKWMDTEENWYKFTY